MASTKPITPTDKIDMDEVITARINIEALAIMEKALIKNTAKNK